MDIATMSSITCCAALGDPVPVRVDGFQGSCEGYGSPARGFGPGPAARRAPPSRRRREFTPEEQKDDTYWLKRSRNNESAKRSRLRRRMEECLLEVRAVELLRENEKLRAALSAIHHQNTGAKNYFGGGAAAQGLRRDACLLPQTDFSPALAAADGPCYGFAGQPHVQRLGPNYEPVPLPGMETFPTHAIYHRDRNVGCQLATPAFREGGAPSQYIPLTYETCQSQEPPELSSSRSSSHPSLLSLGEMVTPHDPRLAGNGPGCGVAHTQTQEVSGPVMSRATKETDSEMKTSKEPLKRALPLLPHKLRYKASKAGRDVAPQQGVHPPRPQSVQE